MVYDYSRLVGRMAEKGFSRVRLAEAIGMSATSLTNKLHSRSYFTQVEIEKISELLGIDDADIIGYFFVK